MDKDTLEKAKVGQGIYDEIIRLKGQLYHTKNIYKVTAVYLDYREDEIPFDADYTIAPTQYTFDVDDAKARRLVMEIEKERLDEKIKNFEKELQDL